MLSELKQSQPTTAAVAAPVAPAPTGPPHLKNIIWNTGLPSVQLDQNLAFEGDRIRGYKVLKITQTTVDLLSPDGTSLVAADWMGTVKLWRVGKNPGSPLWQYPQGNH